MKVAHALLRGCVDYAGLFPPASHDLRTTLRDYEQYREGVHAWALGRLILPAGSLAGYCSLRPATAANWPLSLLLGPEWENDLKLADQLGVRAAAVEFRPSEPGQIGEVAGILPAETALFFEVGLGDDLAHFLRAIAAVGGHAKIRSGGVTESAIPAPSEVVRFLAHCRERGVAFKATAGLHHAMRGVHPLTYAAESERAPMHGFVNFILAAAIVSMGGDPQQAEALLGDEGAADFTIYDDGVRWRDQSFSARVLMRVRESFLLSFGSCSFTEPLAELRQMRCF